MLETNCSEAKEVIDHFISGDEFKTGDKFTATTQGKAGYIFRGQSNSQWQLLPSAFRSNTDWSKYTPQPPPSNIRGNPQKYLFKALHAEAIAIDLFLEAADTLGITTPIDYVMKQQNIELILKARKELDKKQEMDFDNLFPTNDYFRSIALAQCIFCPIMNTHPALS